MVQTENQSGGRSGETARSRAEFYLILYPKELEDEVIQSSSRPGARATRRCPR